MANATFEEFFNLSVLDVVVPTATIGFPSPAQDSPYVDEGWLETLGEEATDRKLAFFGKVTQLLSPSVHTIHPYFLLIQAFRFNTVRLPDTNMQLNR